MKSEYARLAQEMTFDEWIDFLISKAGHGPTDIQLEKLKLYHIKVNSELFKVMQEEE